MKKLIDYLLFRVVEFFNRKYIGFVWFISYYVIYLGFYYCYYELLNGYEVRLYWYDAVSLVFFLGTYLRAKWIIDKLEKSAQK